VSVVSEDTFRLISIRVSTEDPEVTEAEDGWLVRFTVIGPAYRYRPASDSTDTAHVDPPATTAQYLVTEQTVFRTTSVDTVDPREDGDVVHCPPQ
jgi:hypothetical protein